MSVVILRRLFQTDFRRTLKMLNKKKVDSQLKENLKEDKVKFFGHSFR